MNKKKFLKDFFTIMTPKISGQIIDMQDEGILGKGEPTMLLLTEMYRQGIAEKKLKTLPTGAVVIENKPRRYTLENKNKKIHAYSLGREQEIH
jgi:hypothetical protein